MHRLNNAHMLRFHDWYETKNNLWLILEYCAGGNLENILQQDGHLPESSIRIFGLDMISGLKVYQSPLLCCIASFDFLPFFSAFSCFLSFVCFSPPCLLLAPPVPPVPLILLFTSPQYLHSLGYIHGDIRPRNYMIDEYGILKLSDFKFTIKIPKERLEDKSIESRGYPPYMAPELFTSEGCHSYQSDFWSLGCTFYELRRGSPPFGNLGSFSLEKLMSNIRDIDPIHSPLVSNIVIPSPSRRGGNSSSSSTKEERIPSITAELGDLLYWLLEKSPLNRCNWKDLANHPFFKSPAASSSSSSSSSSNSGMLTVPTDLPSQPIYDKLVLELEKARSSKLENDSNAEYDISLNDIHLYNHSLLMNSGLDGRSGGVGGGNGLGGSLLSTSTIHDTPVKKLTPLPIDSTPLRPDGSLKSTGRRGNNGTTATAPTTTSGKGEKAIEEMKDTLVNNRTQSLQQHQHPSPSSQEKGGNNNHLNSSHKLSSTVGGSSKKENKFDAVDGEGEETPRTTIPMPKTQQIGTNLSSSAKETTPSSQKQLEKKASNQLIQGTPPRSTTATTNKTPSSGQLLKDQQEKEGGMMKHPFFSTIIQLSSDMLLMHASDTQVSFVFSLFFNVCFILVHRGLLVFCSFSTFLLPFLPFFGLFSSVSIAACRLDLPVPWFVSSSLHLLIGSSNRW
jgi:serine/threonine protein kinase